MCLITKQSKPIILTEDLIVYKLLRRMSSTSESLKSPIMDFEWELGHLYKTNIEKANGGFFDGKARIKNLSSIELKQLHKKPVYISTVDILLQLEYNTYGPGFHSTTSPNRLFVPTFCVLCECTIPAGSEIYQDLSELVVSNQLIVNKILF